MLIVELFLKLIDQVDLRMQCLVVKQWQSVFLNGSWALVPAPPPSHPPLVFGKCSFITQWHGLCHAVIFVRAFVMNGSCRFLSLCLDSDGKEMENVNVSMSDGRDTPSPNSCVCWWRNPLAREAPISIPNILSLRENFKDLGASLILSDRKGDIFVTVSKHCLCSRPSWQCYELPGGLWLPCWMLCIFAFYPSYVHTLTDAVGRITSETTAADVLISWNWLERKWTASWFVHKSSRGKHWGRKINIYYCTWGHYFNKSGTLGPWLNLCHFLEQVSVLLSLWLLYRSQHLNSAICHG